MIRKVTDIFHSGELEAQRLYNSHEQWSEREVAAVNNLYKQAIDDETAYFIEGQSYFFISTSDNTGKCDCSFRGTEEDKEGYTQPAVIVIDPKTLIFPDYSGNKMFNSLGNIIVNPHIGILFIDFPTATRLRVNGHAEISQDMNGHQEKWPTAKRYVRVTVEQVFRNCSKRIPESM